MPTEISGSTGVNKIVDGTVVTADIAADAIDGTKIADNAVNSEHITAGGVDDAHLATGISASKLTGVFPAISAASLTNVPKDTTVGGKKNMVINGAMQVAQRGTSVTGIDTDSSATEAYRTLDRFLFGGNDSGVWTMVQSTDSPVGFGSSMKLDCTTAKSSLDAGSYLYVLNRIEAQDLQQLGYGTSSPQAITLSFWVKSTKTGTHYVELYHGDSSGSTKRKNSYAYTVSSSNTWEKKSMTFAGDTGVNAIVNDTGWGLMLMWYLAAGSNLQGGTNTNDNWQNTEANRTPGQVNCADSTSNNFYLTGVQLELGSTATDFEYRSYGEELALCQRYYHQIYPMNGSSYATVHGFSQNEAVGHNPFPTTMRASPTITLYGWGNSSGNIHRLGSGDISGITIGQKDEHAITQVSKTGSLDAGVLYGFAYKADAEL